MQMTYVFSDLATGIKRNFSMVVSVIVTIAVSMTLVGIGLLLNAQVSKSEEAIGNKLQIIVYLCNETSSEPGCVGGEVTDEQKSEIEGVLQESQYVEAYEFESQQEAYKKFKDIYVSDDESMQHAIDTVKPRHLKESYWITMKDPQDYTKVTSLVQGMPGVDSVEDLRQILDPLFTFLNYLQWGSLLLATFLVISAILQVSNTIRLAAFARRREIGIMRLVGASNWYVQLPFLLEAVLAAVVGLMFACGALAALVGFVVYGKFRGEEDRPVWEWVDWGDTLVTMGWVAVLGLALALIPTLLMTRKYLKV